MPHEANFGLLNNNLPQVTPYPQAQGALLGLQQQQTMGINQQNANANTTQANSQANYQSAQVKQIAQTMNLQDLSTTSNIFGAVAINPNPASYQQALSMAHKAGLDISDAPTTWGTEAQSFVNNAAVLSKQALEWKQANAQLAMTQAQLNNASADVNVKAQTAGLNTPFPNAPGGSGVPTAPVTISPPGSMPATQTSPSATGVMNGMQQANAPQVPIGTSPAAQVGGPAGLSGNKINQEEQAKNWQTLLDKSQNAASQYEYSNAILNQTADAVDKGDIPTGRFTDAIRGITDQTPYQLVVKNAAIIQQNLVKQLASGGGLGRIMQSELGMISASTPDNGKSPTVNHTIIDNLKANNEILNKIQPELLMKLNDMGIRDPNIAGNVLDKILEKSQVFDPKTGSVDKAAFDRLPKVMDESLKAFQQGKLFNNDTSSAEQPSILQDNAQVRSQIKSQYPNATDAQISQMIQLQNQKAQQQQQTAEKKSPVKSAREAILQ